MYNFCNFYTVNINVYVIHTNVHVLQVLNYNLDTTNCTYTCK